jgi:hypothetical protein
MSKKDWTTEKLFKRLLNNKSKQSYWEYISILRSRPDNDVFRQCMGLTTSEIPKNRMAGIHVLAQLGVSPRPFYHETINRCFELLENEKEPEVIMSILYGIGHNNEKLDKAQIKKLCSYTDTNSSLIKEGLVFSLLGKNDADAIKTLIFFSTDKLSYIRDWATFGIGSLIEKNTIEIRNALWKRINDKHQDVKLEAIAGLAKRKDIRVKEIIKRELLGGEYGILLFEAILDLKDKDFLPLLYQNLKLAENDTTINPEWIKDLKGCITKLEKIKTKA